MPPTQTARPAEVNCGCTVAESMRHQPLQPAKLAALKAELEGYRHVQGIMPEVEEALRNEVSIIKQDDLILDFSVVHGRMYAVVLSESQSATHNSGCLRLIVIGIDLGDKAAWETVIRLPLSAPDCQGLYCIAGEALDISITPTVDWLIRLDGLTRQGHENAMIAIFNTTNPLM